MSWRRRWVVLVPGEAAWVERRTRELLEEDGQGSEHHFMVIPGQSRYQAIVEKEREKIGPEFLIGRLLSLECEEPVYVVEGVEEHPCVSRFVRGEEFTEERKPEELVRSLRCVNEWTVEPPLEPMEPLKLERPTRTAALIQGLSATRVLEALAKREGRPLPPGYYHVEATPLGLLLGEGSGWLTFALIDLAFQFPLATIYSVKATPNLDFFSVLVMRNKETVEFVPPPREPTLHPAIHEIMGERTPERILAALGIPREWFQP